MAQPAASSLSHGDLLVPSPLRTHLNLQSLHHRRTNGEDARVLIADVLNSVDNLCCLAFVVVGRTDALIRHRRPERKERRQIQMQLIVRGKN